jgi:hypothetical protein
MALINCPECNKQISDKANICVGCGAPVVIDLPQSNFKSDATIAEEISAEDITSLNTSNLTPTIDNSNLVGTNSDIKRGNTFFGYLLVSLVIIILIFLLTGGSSSSITQIFETTLTPPTNNTDYINIIGKPIKFGNIEVAQYHFPDKMNWEDANKACADLGEGWKLPNRDELDYLYQNRVAIGGFASFVYWSSTEFDIVSHAWYQYFVNGLQNYTNKSKTNYVRAVRTF